MRAAVTRARGLMEVVDVPEPHEPGVGEVSFGPRRSGLCGSDFHYFLGDIGGIDDPATLYPRIQGHELSATWNRPAPGEIAGSSAATRVAVWPVAACGRCYPCRIGRGNACANISLFGIHVDGGLQERLLLPAAQVFPVGDLGPDDRCADRAGLDCRPLDRARPRRGRRTRRRVRRRPDRAGGRARGARSREPSVLLVDRLERRLQYGRGIGAELVAVETGDEAVVAGATMGRRRRAGGGRRGDGRPELFCGDAVDLVGSAGRVVVVGLSDHDAPFRVGRLPFKEIDVLGVSCCNGDEFAAAVELVSQPSRPGGTARHARVLARSGAGGDRLAIHHPAEVMKAVVTVGSGF